MKKEAMNGACARGVQKSSLPLGQGIEQLIKARRAGAIRSN